jgi:hypothetical protein
MMWAARRHSCNEWQSKRKGLTRASRCRRNKVLAGDCIWERKCLNGAGLGDAVFGEVFNQVHGRAKVSKGQGGFGVHYGCPVNRCSPRLGERYVCKAEAETLKPLMVETQLVSIF